MLNIYYMPATVLITLQIFTILRKFHVTNEKAEAQRDLFNQLMYGSIATKCQIQDLNYSLQAYKFEFLITQVYYIF